MNQQHPIPDRTTRERLLANLRRTHLEDAVIPVPQFISNLTLTLRDIFSWLKVN